MAQLPMHIACGILNNLEQRLQKEKDLQVIRQRRPRLIEVIQGADTPQSALKLLETEFTYQPPTCVSFGIITYVRNQLALSKRLKSALSTIDLGIFA
jgi:hypothetical protein